MPDPTATGPRPGFVPPPYPYDRLDAVRAMAVDRFGATADSSGSVGPGGVVDCSIGTPFDPPPPFVVEALDRSGSERGYPASIGSHAYRRAAADWLHRRFGAEVDPDGELAACMGTKELVASTPQYLRLRTPERDTVLYPAISYPTYAMGAVLGGCRAVPVGELPGGGLDLASVEPADVARSLMVWVNSPSNPTGLLTDLGAAAAWGRARGIPVFSDECYAEFTWDGAPRSVLSHGLGGVVAVHSLSKRSNLAGLRAGFFAGDRELVEYLSVVRRHAGLMVPGPVQAAAALALDDDTHVDEQRDRYRRRLAFLAGALSRWGLPVATPAGGFYLWAPVPAGFAGGGWGLARALAGAGGLLVSPGDLYGDEGAGFVRIAVVQPMERLEAVADRLSRSSLEAAR